MGDQRRTFGRWLASLVIVLTVVLVGSVAFTEWAGTGAGNGKSKAGHSQPLTVSPAEPTTLLYPGTTGDVALTLTNPNPYAVTIRSILHNGTITSDRVGCDATTSQVSFADQDGSWTAPRRMGSVNGALTITLADAASMGVGAATACQDASFTIPVTVSTERLVVVVGAAAFGQLVSSSDGVAWTVRSAPTGGNTLYGVDSNGSDWVAVGFTGWSARSMDGKTWTASRAFGTTSMYDVGWDGTKWVAVGDGGAIYSSVDGSAWTTETSGSTSHLRAIAWSGGTWVAAGMGGTVLTSTDGSTWTSATVGTAALYDVVSNGSLWIAVGDNGTIVTSPDASVWTPRVSDSVTDALRAAAWNGAQWLVVGGSSGKVRTSPDAITWTAGSAGGVQPLLSGTWTGSQWIVGEWDNVRTSPDATTWTVRSTGANNSVRSLASRR